MYLDGAEKKNNVYPDPNVLTWEKVVCFIENNISKKCLCIETCLKTVIVDSSILGPPSPLFY